MINKIKMKKYIYILIFSISAFVIAQTKGVGINTDKPTTMLDVNGEMRVQNITVGDATVENVLTADADGFVKEVPIHELIKSVKTKTEAEFIPYSRDIDPAFHVNRAPTLDLWTKQENGEQIKRYYFIGQQHRVTLPKNLTVNGDNKLRAISFVMIKNATPDGFVSSSSVGSRTWDLVVQTKLFQHKTNSFNGTNGGVCLYESSTSGSGLFEILDGFTTEGSGCFRRQVKAFSRERIGEREITFYDFAGRWIMIKNN